MLVKTLATIACAAVVAATVPDVKKRDDGSLDEAELSSLASIVGITAIPTDPAAASSIELAMAGLTALLPPDSILSVLETAVPASVISDLADPASASAFASSFEAGSYPGWYSSLPDDVKNFFSTYSPTLGTTQRVLATATSTSNTGSTTFTSRSSSATHLSSAASTTHSGNGAPRETAAMAVSAAGIIGLLGLAMGL